MLYYELLVKMIETCTFHSGPNNIIVAMQNNVLANDYWEMLATRNIFNIGTCTEFVMNYNQNIPTIWRVFGRDYINFIKLLQVYNSSILTY